ncbi:MAG: FixH family protein [Wenzhouxiangella sp.]
MQETPANPWYKEPWPFILMSITGLGVVAGTTLAVIGFSNPPEIVSGQFGSLAKFVTEDTARVDQARALGLSGRLALDGDEVVLILSALDAASLPEQLMVQFQHPATSAGDSVALVSRAAGGEYRGSYAVPPHARAHVSVTDLSQSWTLAGRLDAGASIAVEARRP